MGTTVKRIWRIVRWITGIIGALMLLLFIFVQWRWDAPVSRPAPLMSAPHDSATIARGEYIFKYQAQCWGCHADETGDANSAPSGGRLFDLSGTGPGFGIWFSRNITPDKETGIGEWTDGEIVQAIREGVRKNRKVLFPLMPVDWFHGISDSDALALAAYLKSIPPVLHRVPDQRPSFFAKALFAFGVLKPKVPITEPLTAPPAGATAAYGKYLATTVALCMDCHTPRNLKNGEVYSDSLASGSSIAFGDEDGAPFVSFARNITPDSATGIGNWTEAQFLAAVTTGMRPDGTVLDPHMPYPYFKSFSTDDLKAIFLFLRSVPPVHRRTPEPRFSSALMAARGVVRGKLLFQARCETCHGPSGKGATPTHVTLAEVVPSLAEADLKEFVREGNPGLKMPSFGMTLKGEDLDDLVAYLRSLEHKGD
jgi:mono/diheme cytochrome c family protein